MSLQFAHVPASPASSVDASPSSSPVFGPVDSSPPSSPALDAYSLDSPPASFSHPFAASAKAIKRLPDYEKKAASPPCTPPGTFTLRPAGLCRGAYASRSLQEDEYINGGSPGASPPPHRTARYVDRDLWEAALRQPIDTGIGQIDLSNQQLESIPASIGDLAGFFNTPESTEQSLFSARVFARVNTEPARVRSFERTQSIKDNPKERHVLKLYLMNNMISSLPRELFTVKNLTVLSLRKNNLTFIPPEICHLTNLRELNISNNHIQFLPWQMCDMRIEKLLVNPNPFLPEPVAHDDAKPTTRAHRSMTRVHSLPATRDALAGTTTEAVLSPVTVTPALARVPPLAELCLRLLLAPCLSQPQPQSQQQQTVLAAYYGHPVADQWTIPPHVRRTLTDAVPGIVRPRKRCASLADALAREDACKGKGTGTQTCPHPAHKGRIFVTHASARFSWERRVAGVDVGGAVPIRWLGCLATCLDFLDARGASEGGRGPSVVLAPGSQSREDEAGDMDVDVDFESAVRAVDLGAVHLDLDDFDL